ncbi:hypothetical protein B0H13DRAFT_1850518 [Mycena leptocephala]|nr:hypothetical protein B0H13DRAFT_1850518 [Mycena leptocephala]
MVRGSACWGNGLGAQPHKYMLDIIDSYESSDEEDAEEEARCDVMDTSDDAHLDAADAPVPPSLRDSSSTSLKAVQPSSSGASRLLRAGASHAIGRHGVMVSIRSIFQGFLQSHIILHALAYHLACLEAIPGGYERLVAHPESALLLAEQAVHHELKFGAAGSC